jgi:hypothetical protein
MSVHEMILVQPQTYMEQLKPEAVHERVQQEKEELLGHLNKWIQKTNAENAFVTFAIFLITRWLAEKEEKGSASPRPALVEFGAYYFYPHFGNTSQRNASAVASLIAFIEKLKEGRTFEHIVSGHDDVDPKLAEIVSHIRFYLEDVRGTAYITQIREQIEQIHGPFETWFCDHVGIGPKRAVDLLYAIQGQLNENFNAAQKAAAETMKAQEAAFSKVIGEAGDKADDAKCLAFVEAISRDMAGRFPVAREQLNILATPPSAAEWAGLIQLIGLTKDFRNGMSEPLGVKSRPLFVLPDNRVFFTDLSSVVEELFSAFERVARTDQKFFSGKYHQNQKVWTEGKVAEFFKRIFPAENVFTGLTYPNPDKPGDIAEMDTAIEWGSFLVLVETKGKQFRLLEALSDLGRLRTDLKKNVQDAFEQAERAARFINSQPTAIFKELKTGRELKISRQKIRRVFKLSVTLQHLADFATQLANLKSLNLFSKSDYPFSVSLADIDIITRFCEGPDVFLHYIQRRLELQRSEKNIMGDELNLFGTYLETRLQPSLYWEQKPDDGKPFTLMWISDGSEKFDAWHDAQIGQRESAPEIKLKLPLAVKELLAELRNRKDDGARWIAFALLNLSREGADRLDSLLGQIREQNIEPGKMCSTTFVDESLVAVLTAGRMVTSEHLRRTLAARVQTEKYRRKRANAFGFAIELNDPFKPFDFAVWAEGKWEYDSEMEKVLKKMPPMQIPAGQRIPEPNDPCVCGSGNKFKNCCHPFFKK